eukprot:3400713-Amphidinium_carterae.1
MGVGRGNEVVQLVDGLGSSFLLAFLPGAMRRNHLESTSGACPVVLLAVLQVSKTPFRKKGTKQTQIPKLIQFHWHAYIYVAWFRQWCLSFGSPLMVHAVQLGTNLGRNVLEWDLLGTKRLLQQGIHMDATLAPKGW